MTDKFEISRRTFVAGSGAAVAGSAVPDMAAFASTISASSLEHELLSQHIGSEFRLYGDLGAVKLKLVSVETIGNKMQTPNGVRDQAFTAQFSVHDNLLPMSEKTYRISHAGLGNFELYLAPCGNGICTTKMAAIFS